MIAYTNEKIQQLLEKLIPEGVHQIQSTLEQNVPDLVSDYSLFSFHVTLNGVNFVTISAKFLIILLKNGIIESDPKGYFGGIKAFLHDVKFENVPLYINSYPQLAAWRLDISK